MSINNIKSMTEVMNQYIEKGWGESLNEENPGISIFVCEGDLPIIIRMRPDLEGIPVVPPKN